MCRMRGAVETGGGQIVGGAYLGSGATHVVCHPQAAVKWLAMGTFTTWHCIQGGCARVIMLYAPSMPTKQLRLSTYSVICFTSS